MTLNFGGLASYQALGNPSYASALNAPMAPFMDGAGGGAATGLPMAGGGMGAMNIGQSVLSGIDTIGKLWMGFKAAKLAKQNFKFQKNITNTNLANQIKTYNTHLADRQRARAIMTGASQADTDAYISSNSLGRSQQRPTGYEDNYRSAPAASSIGSYNRLASPTSAGSYGDQDRPINERDPRVAVNG